MTTRIGCLLWLLIAIGAEGQVMADTFEGKDIAYRGGLVTFQVPTHWVVEEDASGQSAFYEDGPGTGTLRVHALTLKSEPHAVPSSASEVLQGINGITPDSILKLPNGNALAVSVQRSTEDGTPIILFWWYLASTVPPNHGRVATFSYTVLGANEHSADTDAAVNFLENSIRNARFHPGLSEIVE